MLYSGQAFGKLSRAVANAVLKSAGELGVVIETDCILLSYRFSLGNDAFLMRLPVGFSSVLYRLHTPGRTDGIDDLQKSIQEWPPGSIFR
ncbi:hypothetical protein HJG54_29925 [Leptolyngbya sp. NK1-12]|uniref:Uncharacterized protein n=1 Tax=Leptolyngbya sp. NK1-12 TaxID=2547451 RepID=A0AA96WYM1_9CYAN|nr:hypothetical protein [Leptolyngbya sp. NK1-12]WNZ27132.1 hypothetical protein HJG54_29925 [Leptolyngbya sp. NK1-12]